MKADSLRILVVEDNPLNMRLVRDVLTTRGHTILEARDVDEGRAMLDATTPDLVLMDIQIPGGGGQALLMEIRQKDAGKRIPVIAVTAFAMQGDREKLLAVGFDGYMSKPIRVRTFGEEVEAFVKKQTP